MCIVREIKAGLVVLSHEFFACGGKYLKSAKEPLNCEIKGLANRQKLITHYSSQTQIDLFSTSGVVINPFLTLINISTSKWRHLANKNILELLTYLFYGKVNWASKPSAYNRCKILTWKVISILKRWIYKSSQTHIDLFPFVTLMSDYKSK